MKICIFHFNTGGFDHDKHSIIEVCIMIEDTKNKLSFEDIPKYRTLVYNDVYNGDPLALYMNREILKEISDATKENSNKIVKLDLLALNIYSWISKHVETHVNDKNFNLDFDSFGKNYSSDGTVKANKRPKLLLNVGGKNFGVFQHKFLMHIPNINEYISINHRFFDPSILFFEPNDESLPNTEECKKRAGIVGNVPGNLQECWDVINMLRNKLKY